jgi:putative serine protease PepD
MTENPSGVPGQPGPSGEPAEANTPEPTSPPESTAPTQPAQPVGEPSPWSAAGYQFQQPGEPPAAGSARTGEQPWSGAAAPSSESGLRAEMPVGQPFAADRPSGSGQPVSQQPLPGYPGYYPQTGAQQTAAYSISRPPRRSLGLIIGVAIIALVVGGLAGSLGAYLFSQNSGSSSLMGSSLGQPAGSSQPGSAAAGSYQAVAAQVAPVVVEIAVTFNQNGQSQSGAAGDSGSGVIISPNGWILTNNHVVAGAANGAGTIQVVFSSGKIANATIVGRDPTTDIAVIQAQNVSGLPTAKLGNSDSLSVGQSVVAIGAPFQLAGTVTAGIVSSLHRPVAAGDSSTQETVLDAIQTDAAINPGNSGGALVNMAGEVVGINSAIYSPSSSSNGNSSSGNVGIGFAIPMNQARRIATQLTTTGQATQTVLGVKVADSVPGGNPNLNQATCESGAIVTSGALIVSVTAGGPADQAGLKPGAVVTGANGRSVNSCDGLVAAVHAAAPGDQMKLTLSNGSTVTATLSGQPVKLNG